MIPLLNNTEHQKFLELNGYLKLHLLNESIINKLIDFANKQGIVNNNDCFASNTVLSKEQNKIISKEITTILKENIKNVFINEEYHGGTFLIKRKENGELFLHQDNTIVDNTLDTAYYLWIPLEDVNRNNGCMYVLPGSHNYFNNYVSYSLKNRDIHRNLIPSKYLKDIEMKRGEVLIFSSRLFHGSYKNKFLKNRIAINVLLTNKGAQLVYYNKIDATTISKYLIQPLDYLNSYNEYSKGNLPTNAIFEKNILYNNLLIDHTVLYKKLTNKNFPKYKEIIFKITDFFSNILN